MKENIDSNSGTETLEVISDANHFNRWMYETIKPYCSGQVLEIGSGIGNISRFFLEDQFEISLSDLSSDYFSRLKQNFAEFTNLQDVFCIDFAEPQLADKYSHLVGKFDTVFALNVLEHVEDHRLAIENSYQFLKPGGKLIILVPAFQALYNSFDKALDHYRRYSVNELENVMSIPGFELVDTKYFNVAGILGWIVSGKMMKKDTIPGGQMAFYDKLVPLWKLGDFVLSRLGGLSIICVVQKQ